MRAADFAFCAIAVTIVSSSIACSPQPANTPAAGIPKPNVNTNTPAKISEEEAIAIAKKYLKLSATSGYIVEDRGGAFFIAPPYIKRANAERAGVYVDKMTGNVSKEPPGK